MRYVSWLCVNHIQIHIPMKLFLPLAKLALCVSTVLCCSTILFAKPNTVATPPTTQEGLLLVAFGTSHAPAKIAYERIGQAFTPTFSAPETQWAYTSNIIRKKLAKQGTPVPSIEEALAQFQKKNLRTIRLQSLHIAAGEEFSYMERTALRYAIEHPNSFDQIFIGRPLLETEQDRDEVVRALSEECPQERKANEALLYMAHGQSHGRADLVLDAMKVALHTHDKNAYMATVEGSNEFSTVLKELKEKNVQTIWLMPFMIVAGDHATNDLIGQEDDSWASQLRKEGFTVKWQLKGLGEMAGIQNIFLRHAKESPDNILKKK